MMNFEKLQIPIDSNLCERCGKCSGACPSYRFMPEFNPAQIVIKLATREKEKIEDIFMDPSIWFCTMCHTCLERCPENVAPSHLFVEVKNIAAQQGNLPDSLKKESNQIIETGLTVPISPAIKRRRDELGLMEFLPPNIEEIQKIIKKTKFDQLVG